MPGNLASSSTRHIPILDSSRSNSPSKSGLQTTSSASPLKFPQHTSDSCGQKDDLLAEQSPASKHKVPSISKIPVRKGQPSVADLRKSFEKGAQPPKVLPQTSPKHKQPVEKTPDRKIQDSKEARRSSGSIDINSAHSGRAITRDSRKFMHPHRDAVGRTANAGSNISSEQSSLTRNGAEPAKHSPRVTLPKSSRFRQRDVHNLDGAASFEHDESIEPDEPYVMDARQLPEPRSSKDALFLDSIHPFLSPSSISGCRGEIRGDEPPVHASTIPREMDGATQRPASKPGTAGRCTGKVSDLRRLFERTPTRGTSPNPFKSFWQNRSRNKPKVEVEEIPIARYARTGSPTLSITHISAPKRISLPELTTTILTNDFSCDFGAPETLGTASSMKCKARFDIESDENTSVGHESPVKGRIQQFELLEHGRRSVSPASFRRARSHDVNMNSSPRGKENDAKLVKNRASWRPFRQRSIELWRRISNSFRSIGEEQADPGNYVNLEGAGPSSLRRRLRYRRSDIFSYHLYRSSVVVRSPSTSSHGKSSVSIDGDFVARIEAQPPHVTHKLSPPRDIPTNKGHPFLARTSNNLGGTDESDDFGFDGSILSKATRYRNRSSTGQIRQSSSSPTPLGDPNTLSKVVSQQTVAERKRRRLEEKQLRQGQRDKKREEKLKAKSKEKAPRNERSDTDGKESTATQDKGKGKEVDGKKRESSWNKKTASGFVVRQINDVKLRHPKPRRPGQVRKLVNMYKEKASSGIKLGKGGGTSSGSGAGATEPANH